MLDWENSLISLSIRVDIPVMLIVAEKINHSSDVKFVGWARTSPPTLKNFLKSLSVSDDV